MCVRMRIHYSMGFGNEKRRGILLLHWLFFLWIRAPRGIYDPCNGRHEVVSEEWIMVSMDRHLADRTVIGHQKNMMGQRGG